MALGYIVRFLSGVVAALSIFVYFVHNAGPYLKLECVALSMNCPIAKSYGTINDAQKGESIYLKPLKQIMKQWVRNGYSIGTQLSVFINNKEKLNIFARDDVRFATLDHNSLFPLFSTSKNFAAMLIAVAKQNKWIKSYNDPVIKYWPGFPTKRIVIPFDKWTQYFNKYSSNKTDFNFKTLVKYCNDEGINIDHKPYTVTIADVLRHEGGYGIILANKENEIKAHSTSYQDLKTMLENTEYLIYFKESRRSYHAVTRGYLLNQIFMNVEPKHRCMSDYYNQEIVVKLSENIGDQEYFLSFDGLKNNAKDMSRMFHMIQQPMYWSLYHSLLPIYLGFDRPFNALFAKQMCPSSIMDETLCPNMTLSSTKWLMQKMEQVPTLNLHDWNVMDGPAALSKLFEGELAMAHMSTSLISNAHSVAKTASYMLFSGEVMDEDLLNDMIANDVSRFDMLLGDNSSFTQGGFNHYNYQGVDWYGWGGWGGSMMNFAPQYKCVVAFTVSAFNSPHYNVYQLPRVTTILNLVTLQLLEDNENVEMI